MATKDELIAFADAHGIAVDSSMLKVDIEAAISDAGYDPITLEAKTVSEAATPTNGGEGEDPAVSRNAEFSTYAVAEVTPQAGEENPPPGPQVEQTLGLPTES